MRKSHAILAVLLVLLSVACGSVRADEPVLLLMPEPLSGMTVTKTPLQAEDKVVGYHVQVANKEGVSKVVVQIETVGDRSAKESRVEGLKSYVNGLANGLKGAGFELVSNKVPNLKSADLNRQLHVHMQFKKEDETQLFVRQFIYFTDKGYNVQVFAADEEELERLSRWAQHIKPAGATAEVAWRGQAAK